MFFRIKGFSTLVLVAAMIICSVTLLSQTNPSNVNMIPNIAPPSPDVAKLMQFENYPVNHFTGLANISIPLYEIKAGDITIPINLSYHTAGIKVTEHSGWVGLGWSLEPGGAISRTVMGVADELPAGYLSGTTVHSSISSSNATDLLYLNSIVRGNKDTEPDIYSYSFGNYSGKFVFNQMDDWSKVMIPYSPVKIEHDYDEYDLDFVATDPYGIEYRFDSIHEASSGINDYFSVRSAWKIYKIISSNKQDTVKFSYSSSSGEIHKDISDRIAVDDQVNNPVGYSYFSSNQGTSTVSNISVFGTEQKLTEILFPTGKLVFNLATRTYDGWSPTTNGTQKQLSSIYVYQYLPATDSYERIRVILFDYGYFESTDGTNTKRLKLNSVRMYDGSMNSLDQKYSFDYNTDYILPGYTSRKRDLWGYYNGVNNNTLVPRTTISFQSLITSTPTNITIGSNYSNGRDPNPTYMKACILEKVTYPTGGWTEFDYETNKYLDGTSTYAGGLRISQMTSFSEIGSVAKKQTFKYGENESGYGRANFSTSMYWLMNEVTVHGYLDCGQHCPCDAYKRSRTFMSSPSISIEPYDGSPVVYSKVTVYDGDATTNNGKKVYRYSDIADQINMTFQTGYPAIESKHFKRGLLTSQESFSNATGTPTTARDSSTYGAYSDSTKYDLGLKVKKIQIMDDDSPLGTGDGCDFNGDKYSYTWAWYDIRTGDNRKVSSISTNYSSTSPSTSIATTSTYQYENYEHQQMTKTTTTNSNGVDHVKEIDYVQDVNSTTVLESMINRHMLAYPVTETSKVDGTTMEVLTRDYHNPSTNIYQVEEITRQIGTGSAVTEVEFQEFDSRGNILQYEARDGTVSSFKWGYDGTKPIAQVINAEEEEILFQNYEDGLIEPWVTASNPYQSVSNSEAHSGDYSLEFESYSGCSPACYYSIYHWVPAADLNLDKIYIFSVWVKANNVDDYINLQIKYEDGSGVQYPTAIYYDETREGEWQYLERRIDLSQVSGLVGLELILRNVGSNGYSAYVDDLRFYPADAQMTTYTYDPLIGLSSISDPNNRSMHYEYDDFGRLIEVTDSDGNLLKELEYNYINQ